MRPDYASPRKRQVGQARLKIRGEATAVGMSMANGQFPSQATDARSRQSTVGDATRAPT